MAYTSCLFVANNTTVFPTEFYGTERMALVNIQVLLGSLALGGHLWHAYRARVFKDRPVATIIPSAPFIAEEKMALKERVAAVAASQTIEKTVPAPPSPSL